MRSEGSNFVVINDEIEKGKGKGREPKGRGKDDNERRKNKGKGTGKNDWCHRPGIDLTGCPERYLI
jgi:hypothetical protein